MRILFLRRKKRCIRFLDSSDDCHSHSLIHSSTNHVIAPAHSANQSIAPAPADSTSDCDVTITSLHREFPDITPNNVTSRTSPVSCDSSAQSSSTSNDNWTSPKQSIPTWRHRSLWRHRRVGQLHLGTSGDHSISQSCCLRSRATSRLNHLAVGRRKQLNTLKPDFHLISTFIACLHVPANFRQMYSKCTWIAGRLLDVCWIV